tara:strand:- start:1883 stop:2491 length:609 start_codon:yes stop_codon:yes gene_type:complete
MAEKKGILGFLKGLSPNIEDEKDQSHPGIEEADVAPKKESPGSLKQNGEVTPEIESFCIESLQEILHQADLLGKVALKESQGQRIHIDISDTGDDISRIIGKSGANLESLQIILRHFVIRKFNLYIKVIIDADHYRQRRYGAIKAMSLDAAHSLSESGETIKLESMSPYERSVVHSLFEDDDTISTESEGVGRERCVVLTKK